MEAGKTVQVPRTLVKAEFAGLEDKLITDNDACTEVLTAGSLTRKRRSDLFYFGNVVDSVYMGADNKFLFENIRLDTETLMDVSEAEQTMITTLIQSCANPQYRNITSEAWPTRLMSESDEHDSVY